LLSLLWARVAPWGEVGQGGKLSHTARFLYLTPWLWREAPSFYPAPGEHLAGADLHLLSFYVTK
jgi:hypothetical protein